MAVSKGEGRGRLFDLSLWPSCACARVIYIKCLCWPDFNNNYISKLIYIYIYAWANCTILLWVSYSHHHSHIFLSNNYVTCVTTVHHVPVVAWPSCIVLCLCWSHHRAPSSPPPPPLNILPRCVGHDQQIMFITLSRCHVPFFSSFFYRLPPGHNYIIYPACTFSWVGGRGQHSSICFTHDPSHSIFTDHVALAERREPCWCGLHLWNVKLGRGLACRSLLLSS